MTKLAPRWRVGCNLQSRWGSPCFLLLPPRGWRAQARGCSLQCTIPRVPHPHPGVLLCELPPGEARSRARLPAAEVTVSPKRSHSPSSMNPDQAREHRAGRKDACG